MEFKEYLSYYQISLKKKYKDIRPLKVYNNINKVNTVNLIKKELKNYGGIYGFLCKNNSKIYIGSSERLVYRFLEHTRGRKSNIKLQRALLKYGLGNFYYIIFNINNVKDNKNINNSLINLETLFISYFKIKYLFNFKIIATSMLGYKHSILAKAKMKERYKIYKHPFLGKHHSMISKEKISLATKGENSKEHNSKTKDLISAKLSKPVYMYIFVNNKFKLKETYPNSLYVAKLLNLHKTTIGKYIKNKKIFI